MKQLFGLIIIALTLFSCGPSKTVQESRKVIKGEWTLNDISYSEAGQFEVELLGDTSSECFTGSSWRFVPNNNRGTYDIGGAGCPVGTRYFIFTIQEVDPSTGLYDFLLKPTNEKYRSETNVGIRLRLAALDASNMRWEQTVNLDGSPFVISMNFIKTAD